MCGIVAAVAERDTVPFLLEGLGYLEYRGYDSAGLAVVSGGLRRVRSTGRVMELAARAREHGLTAGTGIAHTRWATHGRATEENAHPHVSGGVAVVHNGIIENYRELQRGLEERGYVFESETDTEVIAHLIHEETGEGELLDGVRRACERLRGAYAIAVVAAGAPGRVVVAKRSSPLLVGIGEEGRYAASDAGALAGETREVVYLEDGDVAELTAGGHRIVNGAGEAVERTAVRQGRTERATGLGGYRHYMQKEIFEQPEALAETLWAVAGGARLGPEIFGEGAEEVLAGVRRVLFVACGTSYHAGLVGRHWVEERAGIPATVEVASEYRYRTSIADEGTLVVAISQSGETADTIAALRYARGMGMERTLAVCNVAESTMVREARLRFVTRAGPEIGVASTKAFTTQLAGLALLALTLGKLGGRLPEEEEERELAGLRHLPVAVQRVLALEGAVARWAERLATKHHALFLGRGSHWPIALEGALKLKEISYIHAEGYAAGELKHGPLALVDEDMPVFAVAPADELVEKLKNNLHEVRARGGELYVFADAGSEIGEEEGVHVLAMPEHYGMLSPVLHVVPLQLLAYHAAQVKGTDVDKPRNLAKSVTVE
jgi:glucosamine--fructose-6-phosphate aminotransferase (isomerizing)